MTLQTHIQRRNGRYYHRIRVPLDLASKLARSDLTISLQTSDPTIARHRGHLASLRANQLFEIIRSRPMLTEEQIKSIIVEFYQDQLREDEMWRVEYKKVDWKNDPDAFHHLQQYFDIQTDEELEEALNKSGMSAGEAIQIEINSTEEALTAGAIALFEWDYADHLVDAFLKRKGIELPTESVEYNRLLMWFLRARNEAMRISRHRSEGDWTVEPKEKLFRDAASFAPTHGVLPAVTPRKESTPATMNELVEEFIQERARIGGKPRPLGEMRTSLKWFIDYFGPAKRIDEYTAHDFRTYKNELMKVPANFSKLLKCDNIREAISLNVARKLPTLDVASINGNRLGNVDAFFRWAEENRYISEHPGKGIRVATPKGSQKRKKRDAFSIDQLTKIFRSPIYTGYKSAYFWKESGSDIQRDHRFWMPLLALYTGGRKTELAQLNMTDVCQIDGVWCFKITDLDEDEDKSLKNIDSNRIVPLHPELHRLGLVEYIAARNEAGSVKLLDCEPGVRGDYSPFSQWFPRFLDFVEIKRGRLAFHSFRHCFEQAMLETDLDFTQRSALGGRSTGHSSEHYTTGYKPKQLFEAISKVQYEGLDLSHLYPANASR